MPALSFLYSDYKLIKNKSMKYKIEIWRNGIHETIYYRSLKLCNDEVKLLRNGEPYKITKL